MHLISQLQYKYDKISNVGKLPLRVLLENNNDSLVSSEKLGFNVNTINSMENTVIDLCKNFFDKSRVVKDGSNQ